MLFLLWRRVFLLSGVVSLLFSSSILGTCPAEEFIFQFPIFLLFHTVHGVLKARIWSGLPFSSPVDHVLSELSTMTRLSWVTLHGIAHSFVELDKAVIRVISLMSFLWLWFSFYLPSDVASCPITSWQVDGATMETVRDFIFVHSRITADGDYSHAIKRCSLLGRKAMTNLDSILKSRDITLPTKVCLVKAMVFLVVMYGCESWTMKKTEHWRIDAFELWWWWFSC